MSESNRPIPGVEGEQPYDPAEWLQGLPFFDEPGLRRPSWSSCGSVPLDDGNVWHFPRVTIENVLLIPNVVALIRRWRMLQEAGQPPEGSIEYFNMGFALDGIMRGLGAGLLPLNYRLTDDEAFLLTRYPVWHQAELTHAVLDAFEDGDWGPVIHSTPGDN